MEKILIKEECRIPGTEIVLEAGDIIHIGEAKDEDRIEELKGFIKDLYAANRQIVVATYKSKLNTKKEIQDVINGLEGIIRNLDEIDGYKKELDKLEK